jgi:phage baseplate assembly protein W
VAGFARPFLGKGWHFPPTFTENGRDIWSVADEADIQQSLHILLATAQGERVMREDFGCDLNRFMFEEMGGSLRSNLVASVKKALLHYEPRIKVEKVDVEASSETVGMLLIQVIYLVPASNSRFNLVYPFYLNEATYGRP